MGLVSGSKCPNNCQCQAQEVVCTGVQLTEYPRDVPLDTRRLYLNDNKMVSLPAMPLGLLSDLVYLDCRNNRIREVMDYTFIGVFKLIYLDLSSNNLTSISPFSFSVLSNLVQLSIANNPHLLSLHKHTFANTSSLRHLDLRNTGLQTLDHDAFHHLTALQTLYLSGNPWKCNCSFLDFAIYLIVSHLSHPDAKRSGTERPRGDKRSPGDFHTLTGTADNYQANDNPEAGDAPAKRLSESRDGPNATCVKPTELAGWPIAQVGNPLRYMCLTHLDRQDYIFLLLIGFCIFSAGTVAAWLTGVCAVVYQNAHRKSNEDEADDEAGHKVEVSRRLFQTSTNSVHAGFPQLI
ncbi:Leucine-rich repeat-containing protein 52 [Sciurus carolinensis]|uniref:Leucine-rich repeat-containing protein 52 n=1 Tax=Sciurus carolinensis TaxID=30640 RepID=A0AA41MVI5_SCICA|nr:Leucine-rich repeat-containing protein 52 [Sciurus carolinensis]